MRLFLATLLLLVCAPLTRSGSFVSGSTSCPSSGNTKVSTTNYALYQLTVSSKLSNTGYVHVGSSAVTTSDGGELAPGWSYTASKPSAGVAPNTLYFACTVSADSISWVGTQ